MTLDQPADADRGVTAERSTNDGDINKFYYYPRYSASYRVPTVRRLPRRAQAARGVRPVGQPRALRRQDTSPLNQTLDRRRQWHRRQLDCSAIRNIKPESEQETETGFDATMFHSRAQFSATVYQKRLTSLLLQAGVAPSYGYTSVYINGGEFTNQGIELSLQDDTVQLRNGFTWVSTATVSRNYSVVDKLPGGTVLRREGLLACRSSRSGRSSPS